MSRGSSLPPLRLKSTSTSKLDRLLWTVERSYVAYGTPFGLRANSPAVMQRLIALLPPGSRESKSRKVDCLFSVWRAGKLNNRGAKRLYVAYRNGSPLWRGLDLEDLYVKIRSQIHLYLASVARTRMVFHAGVVGWQGKAILIPGFSLSGKSTLVTEFVKAGATFYSDEYAMIDKSGFVHPFPRPIHRRDPENRDKSEWISIETLGGRIGKKPLSIGMVILSRYQSDAKWRPRRLPTGRAILSIMQHCVTVRSDPQSILKLLKKIVPSVRVFKGYRGDALALIRWCAQVMQPNS